MMSSCFPILGHFVAFFISKYVKVISVIITKLYSWLIVDKVTYRHLLVKYRNDQTSYTVFRTVNESPRFLEREKHCIFFLEFICAHWVIYS